jgi:hypothetical protein
LALIVFPLVIILESKYRKSGLVKPLSLLSAIISWLILFPAGKLYLTFYPATKTLIKAGSTPWLHFIIMEAKEHWGLLLPIITTLAAFMIFDGKIKESKRWWVLVIVLTVLLAIMGLMITRGSVL